VQRYIELSEKLAKMPQDGVDGIVGFALTCNGEVMAGGTKDGVHSVYGFKPVGHWAKVADRLKLEKQVQDLFAQLTDEEVDEYRAYRGLPPRSSYDF
jgi:hypothetical protein